MIIGLTGYAQVGKDTAADCLTGFARMAFATILKEQCNAMLRSAGIRVNFLRDEQAKREWRDFLVFWGAKRRQLEADYWIRQLAMSHEYSLRNLDCLITDVRYTNEVEFILNMGGRVIEITRSGVGPANEEERISFTIMKERFNDKLLHIDNSGTIPELHKAIQAIIKSFS